MTENLTARLEGLAHGVLGPLVLGGPMRLVPPIGPELAMRLGEDGRRIVDNDLRTRVDVARVRQARRVIPIDSLPDPSPADWALVAALNDLLQTTNHHLSGPFTRSRHEALLRSVNELLGRIPLPKTLGEAVVRHATFARILEVVRTDTRVTWWAGSSGFRGEPPSPRLLAWKEVRRVHVEPHTVSLADMPEGMTRLQPLSYTAALALLLTRSPLTDLATIVRTAPPFAWSLPTLAFVRSARGCALATRVVARHDPKLLAASLEASVAKIPVDAPPRLIAQLFSEEALARVRGPIHRAS